METASLPSLLLDGPRRIFCEAPLTEKQGERIWKLASSRLSVREDEGVNDLAAAMDKAPEIVAVGVVDTEDRPVGLVLRQELFDQLGKPYGRDYFKRKPVSALMRQARSFHEDLNIFAVADTVREELRRTDDTWYLLVDGGGKYSGVFSTKNLLIYLSDTTARDIMLARRLQTAIVRENLSMEDPRCTIVCSSKMAKEVGGDFYLVKRLDDSRTLVGLCDVSGKGIAASLVTAVLGGIFDTYTRESSLREFLTKVNLYLVETFQLEYFVTGVFLELDQATRTATFSDMGHSYVVVMEGGKLFRLSPKAANPPLGVSAALTPAIGTYQFRPGSMALLFTDGIVEQTNREGLEYSQARLYRLLKSHRDLSPSDLKDALSSDFETFRGDQPQGDDLTFVILKYS
ncbi:MAG TPA: SpoIIE family protein phosphatase [Spirochaetia bacterium]|nr:SpoIIE family protein phosphatase [Spirochaetia bacterium]